MDIQFTPFVQGNFQTSVSVFGNLIWVKTSVYKGAQKRRFLFWISKKAY